MIIYPYKIIEDLFRGKERDRGKQHVAKRCRHTKVGRTLRNLFFSIKQRNESVNATFLIWEMIHESQVEEKKHFDVVLITPSKKY